MKRALLIGCITILTAGMATAQDFVSKFMLENKQDTLLHCISVSPKMMGKVLNIDVENEKQKEMRLIMKNLKSMQIVSAKEKGSFYFNKAEKMMERNGNRFEPFLSYDDGQEGCRIMLRKRDEIIIELVMLNYMENNFLVINFTGNMNDEFIDNLFKTMIPKEEDED